MKDDVLARGLGWFGIGLGLVQLLAPRSFGRSIGVEAQPWLLRTIGLRQIASGVGLLTRPEPRPWIETRATGDLVDLALLGIAFSSASANRDRLAAAAAVTAGITALDVLYGALLERGRDHDVHVRSSIFIERPPEPLYAFWRTLENLPLFMSRLDSVSPAFPHRWHWVARGPLGTTVEWDTQIIDDRANALIAWRSIEASPLDAWGAVSFAPVGRGTVVHLEMGYRPPRGALGARVAKLFGRAPEQQAGADLRAFKELMESRETGASGSYAGARPEPLDQARRS
jgi:uncharacterized membrane protein